jgi:CBS domain-containing protein
VRAKDVMSGEVMSIAADATVFEAIGLLVNTGVSAMPVLDPSGVMVGIVSEADLILAAASGAAMGLDDDSLSRSVTDVMTKQIVIADENAPIREIAELMLKHRVKRVPIRSGQFVVGVVSRVDLLKAQLSAGSAADTPNAVTGQAQHADEKLRRDVMAAVQSQHWSVARRADVVVNGGVAHLWGVVPSDSIRDAYQLAAKNVPGVKAVKVHMHVAAQPARAQR